MCCQTVKQIYAVGKSRVDMCHYLSIPFELEKQQWFVTPFASCLLPPNTNYFLLRDPHHPHTKYTMPRAEKQDTAEDAANRRQYSPYNQSGRKAKVGGALPLLCSLDESSCRRREAVGVHRFGSC